MKKADALVREKKPPRTIAVGDMVSRNLCKHGIIASIMITDNRSLKRRVKPADLCADRTVQTKNPPGTITEEAITALRKALLDEVRTHILVEGEEDLLTLVAVLHAPEKSLVFYGQPHKGVVVVEATREKKAEAAKILGAMAVRKPK